MTDIVGRLRLRARGVMAIDPLDIEAADEIERLRAAIQTQGAEIDRVCKMALTDKDEIERLGAALTTIRSASVSGHIRYYPVHRFIDDVLNKNAE